jgi:hypothetical protein
VRQFSVIEGEGARFIFMSEIGGSGGGEWNGSKVSGASGHCRMCQAASAGTNIARELADVFKQRTYTVRGSATAHSRDLRMFLGLHNVQG